MKRIVACAKVATLALVALAAVAASGCGYRIVRNSDLTAQRIAHDSATVATMRSQFVALQLQCHADSLRLESQLATQRASAATTPQPDSLLKSRTAEVAALKDQLAKVNAELDRIKRRLANPRG